MYTYPFQTQLSVTFLSASCSEKCVEPISVLISFSPPVIDFVPDKLDIVGGIVISVVPMNTAEVVGGCLEEEFEISSDTQSFLVYLFPKSDSSAIVMSVPSGRFTNRYKLKNMSSNTVSISLEARSNNGRILTRSSIPSPDQLECDNCQVISVSLDSPDLLRIILQVDSEGYGSLQLPGAISINENGVVSEPLHYSFYYGN